MTELLQFYHGAQDALLAHAGSWWSYLATFALCWIDAFFPPLPAESIVIALAALAMHGGPVAWWILLPCAFVGAFLGDCTAFWIGRKVPLERWVTSEKGTARIAKARSMLQRRGPEVLITARFIPVYRVFMNMAAGTLGVPFARFARIDIVSVTIWVTFAFGIGAASGAVLGKTSPLLGVVVGVSVGLIVGVAITKVQEWRRRRADADEEARAETGTGS